MLDHTRMTLGINIHRRSSVPRSTSQMNKAKLPTHVELDSSRYALVKDSVVLLEQLRTIDKKRLRDKVCHLDREILRKVERALLISLDLNT